MKQPQILRAALQRLWSPALLASAAAFVLAGVPIAGRTADPFELNVIMPVTGPLAFVGKSEGDAMRALETFVNAHGGVRGRPIKVNILDDATNPQNSVQLTNELIGKKVTVFAGSSLAAMCNAMAPLVKNGPLQYCFSPSFRPEVGGFVFSGDFSSDDCIKVGARYLRDRGLRRIAVLNATDATGQDADKAIDEILAQKGNETINVVAREHFNPSDISVRAQLTRIKAVNPQALISYASGAALATILRGMQEVGLDVPILSSPANMSYPQLDSYKAFVPAQLLFPGHAWFTPEYVQDRNWRQKITEYTDSIKAAGQRPDKIGAEAWDVGMLIVEALRRAGPDASSEKLRETIMNMNGVYGVLGRYDYRTTPMRGLNASSIPIDRWDPVKGDFVAVSKPGGEPIR